MDNSALVERSEPLLERSISPLTTTNMDLILIPHWKDQITLRGLLVGALLGTLFCIITHKLTLSVGVLPSLNIAAGLLGFFFLNAYIAAFPNLAFPSSLLLLKRIPLSRPALSPVMASLLLIGGTGSHLLAMDEKTYKVIGEHYPGNRPEDVKNPGLLWMIGFSIVVSFLGLFSLIPLRKLMIMDYKLTFPSGTSTAMLINSFHTSTGAELARKQLTYHGKSLSISFCSSSFKWFFSGIGGSCEFDHFPYLGLTLYKFIFYFDFSPTYVGCDLICPHIVNCSTLPGAIVSWGFLWPLISQYDGDWDPAGLSPTEFKGLYGYKAFIAISLILGDGFYNLIKIITIIIREMCKYNTGKKELPVFKKVLDDESSNLLLDQKRRDEVFLKNSIPFWFAASGYACLAAISTATIPIIFPSMKWYLVLCSYIIAPALALIPVEQGSQTATSLPLMARLRFS